MMNERQVLQFIIHHSAYCFSLERPGEWICSFLKKANLWPGRKEGSQLPSKTKWLPHGVHEAHAGLLESLFEVLFVMRVHALCVDEDAQLCPPSWEILS